MKSPFGRRVATIDVTNWLYSHALFDECRAELKTAIAGSGRPPERASRTASGGSGVRAGRSPDLGRARSAPTGHVWLSSNLRRAFRHAFS
jgi:hypothetical protein